MMKDGEIKNKLSPAQVSVMRHKVSEPPYFGKYWDHYESGTYACAACDTNLFDSAEKFDSKTGWPTFRKPLNERHLQFKNENGVIEKIEIRCRQCKSHLGYVVSHDTPYYRINSVCLQFRATPVVIVTPTPVASIRDMDRAEKKPVVSNAPVRQEFPLPPPPPRLIEHDTPPRSSRRSLAVALVIGSLFGALGSSWYFNGLAATERIDAPHAAPATTTETVQTGESAQAASDAAQAAPENASETR
jgi:peptide-methionine (R)-S-oxide reductase